jgi:hypothetical protein
MLWIKSTIHACQEEDNAELEEKHLSACTPRKLLYFICYIQGTSYPRYYPCRMYQFTPVLCVNCALNSQHPFPSWCFELLWSPYLYWSILALFSLLSICSCLMRSLSLSFSSDNNWSIHVTGPACFLKSNTVFSCSRLSFCESVVCSLSLLSNSWFSFWYPVIISSFSSSLLKREQVG